MTHTTSGALAGVEPVPLSILKDLISIGLPAGARFGFGKVDCFIIFGLWFWSGFTGFTTSP